jgi:predicted transcriptional regulator
MAKVTFTVDDATVRTLRTMAERLGKPQSMVVREAIAEYGARAGRLTEAERRRMLAAIDAMMKRPSTGSPADVAREVREIRRARRHGGRRHPVE